MRSETGKERSLGNDAGLTRLDVAVQQQWGLVTTLKFSVCFLEDLHITSRAKREIPDP